MPNTREKLIELLKQFETPVMFGDIEIMKWTLPTSDILTAFADHLIANGVTVQGDKDINVPTKWISVKDRLPDCADTVLAVDRDGIRATAYYVGYWHSGGELDEYSVTHWMPLPEPPEGE